MLWILIHSVNMSIIIFQKLFYLTRQNMCKGSSQKNAALIWTLSKTGLTPPRLCHRDNDLSKSQRASKSHQWFKSFSHFTEGVEIAHCWSFIGKVLRLQQACLVWNRVTQNKVTFVGLSKCSQFLVVINWQSSHLSGRNSPLALLSSQVAQTRYISIKTPLARARPAPVCGS